MDRAGWAENNQEYERGKIVIKITICIPTRGNLTHLQEALSSLERISTSGLELFVLDNSPSQSLNNSSLNWNNKSFAPQIVKSGGTLSMAQNWNRSFELGTGEWIHILHDDDWVEPLIYSSFLSDVGSSASFGLWCGATQQIIEPDPSMNSTVTPTRCYTDTASSSSSMIFDFVSCRCVSVILNRAASTAVGLFDTSFEHLIDIDLFGKVACLHNAQFSNTIVGNYRGHSSNATGYNHSTRRHLILDDGRLLRDCRKMLTNYRKLAIETPSLRRYIRNTLRDSAKYYLRYGSYSNLKDYAALASTYFIR